MRFRFSGTMVRFLGHRKEIEVAGAATVREAIDDLVGEYPDARPVLLDGAGDVRQVHRLFLNGEALDPETSAEQALGADDTVEVVTAIAGG